MTNYVNIDELKKTVYFITATLDDRLEFEEITPDLDGTRRFRLTGCAHRPVDRDGVLCTHCGDTVVDVTADLPSKRAPRRRKK